MTVHDNEQRDIFLGNADADADRAAFLNVPGATSDRFDWRIHACCLVTSHYHLLVEAPDANLSKGMRRLNGPSVAMSVRHFQRVHDDTASV